MALFTLSMDLDQPCFGDEPAQEIARQLTMLSRRVLAKPPPDAGSRIEFPLFDRKLKFVGLAVLDRLA